MKRLLAASAILGAATVLAAWTPSTRVLALPPSSYSFQELDQMEQSSSAAALAWLALKQRQALAA